jgi:hypothetical protein
VKWVTEGRPYGKFLPIAPHNPISTDQAGLTQNNDNPQEIGEYISAMSNGAALNGVVATSKRKPPFSVLSGSPLLAR